MIKGESMKRKIYITISILILICTAFVFAACDNGGGNIADPITPKEWTEYIDEMSAYLTKTVTDVDFRKEYCYDYSFNVDFTFDDESKEEYDWNYTLRIFGNIGESGVGDGVIKIVDEKLGKNLLHIFFDNERCYVEFGDKKLVYENFNINSAVMRYLGDGLTLADELYLGSVINSTARLAFYDGYANKERTKYVFKFDLKGVFEAEGFKMIFNSLPTELINYIYSYVEVDNFEDFLSDMPNMIGEIKYTVKDGKVTDINIDGADFSSHKDKGKISFDMGNMSIENGKLDSVENERPKSDVGYISHRFGQFSKEGNITLETDDSVVAEYSYFIDSNVDLMELVASGFNFNVLSDDNYFHLRVSHSCGDSCGAYCDKKYMAPKGSILDIAFSPKDFNGSKKLYMSFNLKAFLNEDAMSKIAGSNSLLNAVKFIADYKLLTLETSNFSEFLEEIGSFSLSDMFDLIALVTSSFDYYTEDQVSIVSVEYMNILEKAGLNADALSVIKAVFSDGSNYATKISFSISDVERAEYDIYNQAIHIIDKNVSEIKNYKEVFDSADPALDWVFDDYVNDGGVKVYNVYNKDGNKMYGYGTPISANELSGLVGAKLGYSYTDINFGEKSGYYAEIIEIIDMDIRGNGEYSTVMVKVKYPSQWMGSLISALGYTEFVSDYLYEIVELKIELDTVLSIDIQRSAKSNYYYGENVSGDFYDAVAIVNYVRGNKSVKVKGVCPTLNDMMTSGDHGIVYDVMGEKIVKWVTVGEKSENRSYDIDFRFSSGSRVTLDENGIWHYSGEVSATLYDSSTFNYMRLKITHPDGSVTMRNIPKSEIYFVSEDNARHYYDSDYMGVWRADGGNKTVFLRAGRYEARSDAYGLCEEEFFVFDISEKSSPIDKSRYKLEDSTIYRSAYFDNHSYSFTFKVLNSYHGSVGLYMQEFKLSAYFGYTDNYGGLSFVKVENEGYIEIESVTINGLTYKDEQGKLLIDLPASIKKDATITIRVKFLKTGYYQLRADIGSTLEGGIYTRSKEIRVEKAIPKPNIASVM